MANIISYRSIAHSGGGHRSALSRLVGHLGGPSAALSRAKAHAMATGNAVRQGGESVVVGGLLGVAHVELKGGLDVNVAGKARLPIDAVGGAACLAAGIALAHEEYGRDLTNAGAAALSVFAFRKAGEFAAKKKLERGAGAPGGRIAGEDYFADYGSEEDDAIIRAARSL